MKYISWIGMNSLYSSICFGSSRVSTSCSIVYLLLINDYFNLSILQLKNTCRSTETYAHRAEKNKKNNKHEKDRSMKSQLSYEWTFLRNDVCARSMFGSWQFFFEINFDSMCLTQNYSKYLKIISIFFFKLIKENRARDEDQNHWYNHCWRDNTDEVQITIIVWSITAYWDIVHSRNLFSYSVIIPSIHAHSFCYASYHTLLLSSSFSCF